MKNKIVSFIIVFVCIYSVNIFSQDNDFDTFIETGKFLVSAPEDWNASDWQTLAGVTTISGAAFFIDQDVKLFVQNNKSPFFDALFSVDDVYIQSLSAATLFTYLYGVVAENESMQNAGLDMIEAILYSGLANRIMKISFGRARPYMTDDPYVFEPPSFSSDYSSFPSGHTTFAFSISTVIAAQYENTYWKAGWYSSAVIVGLARIYNNKHWLSDVLMGAAMGYFIGSFVVDKKKTEDIPHVPQNKPFLSFKIAL